jgi:hypothetical protein
MSRAPQPSSMRREPFRPLQRRRILAFRHTGPRLFHPEELAKQCSGFVGRFEFRSRRNLQEHMPDTSRLIEKLASSWCSPYALE